MTGGREGEGEDGIYIYVVTMVALWAVRITSNNKLTRLPQGYQFTIGAHNTRQNKELRN